MEFWYALIGIVAFFIVFPYIRCFFKRLICMVKIKKICRKKGYRLYATHPFWFLGSKHGKTCDLYIETESEVFAIKLFGMPKRSVILILQENGEYVIRRFIAVTSNGAIIQFPIQSKPKGMPNYDFQHACMDAWKRKTQRRILLVHPVSMEFRYQTRYGSEAIVGAGDVVNGMEIHALPHLLGDLGKAL